MPTVSSVLTQRRFFCSSRQSSADRVKNGVFRFYYRPLRSAQASGKLKLNDLDGARGAPARVANAFAAPDAGGTDVVWTMVPTACGMLSIPRLYAVTQLNETKEKGAK